MKKTAKIIPWFIVIILIGLLYLNNLKIEMTIPAKGWSRPVDLKAVTNYPVQIFHYNNNGNVEILFSNGTEMNHLTVDKKLMIKNVETLPVSGDTNSPVWYNNGKLVYQKGDILNLYDGTKTIISEKITTFTGKENLVVFAVEKNLYSLDLQTKKENLMATFDHPISNLLLSKSTEDILVVQKIDDSSKRLSLLHNDVPISIGEIKHSITERVDEIDFDMSQNNGLILYEIMSIVQGERSYRPYYLPFAMSGIQSLEAKPLVIEGEFTSTPRDFNVSLKNGIKVLFTAEGITKGKKSKVNVYEASLVKSSSSQTNVLKSSEFDLTSLLSSTVRFTSERRSMSETIASKPFHLDDNGHSIAWFGFDGEKYHLLATSTDADIVKTANAVNKNDYKIAAFQSVTNLFSAILSLFFALLWMFPPVIFYFVMFLFQGHRFESNRSGWIVPFAFLTYLITQIYFFKTQFGGTALLLAPDYLKISNGLMIWPTILGIISFIIYVVSKREDTSIILGLFYLIGIDILFISLLLGVYIL